MSTLGERLRRERTRRKERQADTAARFGISQPSYHRWESGENTPDDERFADIAQYLGCDLNEVWRMVHDTPMPTSLEEVHSEVLSMRRDFDDLVSARREVADLRAQVSSLMEALGQVQATVEVLGEAVLGLSREESPPDDAAPRRGAAGRGRRGR